MKAILKYSSRHQHLALKCLAVADMCRIPVESLIAEDVKQITFNQGSELFLEGSPSICAYLANTISQSEKHQAKTMQWTSFASSEICPYPASSKQMTRSLQYLETILADKPSLGLLAYDMIVGFPLLQLPAQVMERFPRTHKWLELVKTMSTPHSTQLQQHLEEAIPKKEAKKKPDNKKEKAKVEEKKRKLKVLCIHGYRQSGKSAREKLGSFRKLVGKYADLDFVTAPHLIPSDNPDEQDQYGWWFSKSSRTFDAHEDTDCDLGFQESVQLIEDTLRKEAESGSPYDGVFSFSQGASLGAYLCVLQQMGKLNAEFKFCVLVAGFVSRTQNHKEVFESLMRENKTGVTIPTLHVFGDTDKVIEREMSENLLQYFSNTDLLRHAGGHFVPASGEEKKAFVAFFEKMQKTFA